MKTACLFGIALVLAAPAAVASDLARRDWSVTANPSVTQNAPTSDEVRSLVHDTLKATGTPELCSFKFIDPAHDGTYRLAATLDTAGRHTCTEFAVIGKKDGAATLIDHWKVWQVDNIDAAWQDINHDGRQELVLQQNWSPYDGVNHCTAVWQAIYQWDNGKFVDHSSAFPAFYKQQQTALKTALDNGMGYGSDAVCQQMEIDKIDRFLTLEPNAGFTRAEQWLKSDDASMRRKAAAVFFDIGGADARDDLKKLIADPSPLVVEQVKAYLANMQ